MSSVLYVPSPTPTQKAAHKAHKARQAAFNGGSLTLPKSASVAGMQRVAEQKTLPPLPTTSAESRGPLRLRIDEIQLAVASQYGITRSELLSSNRTAKISRIRQVAMYLAVVLTKRSFAKIGRHFGGRDHTTVMYAESRISHLISTHPSIAKEIEEIKGKLAPALA